MKYWWNAAVLCGAVPLTAGLIIFAIWCASRAAWLMEAGFFTIAAGLVLVVIGLVCLIVYCRRARSGGVMGWKARAALGGLLLFFNFPAAAGLTVAALYVQSSYLVIVENHSAWPLEDLSFQSPRGEYAFGTVPSNTQREKTFHFAGEGAVTYDATLNRVRQHGVLDGYISGNGGKARLVITDEGDVEVHNERF